MPVSHSKSEVILAKRYVLIGEVVDGGPLPSPPEHVPVCSFDAQNKYRGEGPLAEPAVAHFRGTRYVQVIPSMSSFAQKALFQPQWVKVVVVFSG